MTQAPKENVKITQEKGEGDMKKVREIVLQGAEGVALQVGE